jgi:AcrR family transcriptional regulator
MTEHASATPHPLTTPTVAARRRRSPVQTRDKILKAATAEFAQYGLAGARVSRIVTNAEANPRMLYHYFGSKAELYIAVLEEALGALRSQELALDVEQLAPIEGLLQLFDFMNHHFEQNTHLVRLLTTENLLEAKLMRRSAKIRRMSTPVMAMIAALLARGEARGQVATGVDPLRLYVMMVALCQFHISNVHTLSFIFDRDLSRKEWRAGREQDARRMLQAYLTR